MKKFKKIYLEITNSCNLNCDFCIKNNRSIKYLSVDEFKIITTKLKGYTDYLYFHLLGEPMMHPKINELINLGSQNFKINITTNGYMIDKIKSNKNIRQINVSLHSFDDRYKVSLAKYLDNIFDSINELIKNKTYISLRLWVKTKYYSEIVKYISNRYNIIIDKPNIKINKYLFINSFHEFIWPDLNNNTYEENGTCYGLIDHIGILVDGTIVPCCLDSRGDINLGNIYTDELDYVLSSKRVNNIINGFKTNKKAEELCKHCKFITNKQ